MRFTRFSGIVATTALGAATVLGGAGIAQAQSSGSLGSLTAGSSAEETPAPAPALELSLDTATLDEVKGSFTNKSGEGVEACTVLVSNAALIKKIEEESNKDDGVITPLPTALQTEWDNAAAAGQNWGVGSLAAESGKSEDWTAGQIGEVPAEKDYLAGAYVMCDIDGQIEYAFDYEADEAEATTGSLGNIFGSLGSSNGDDDKTPA